MQTKKSETRFPPVLHPLPGPGSGYQAAAVLLRRAALKLEKLAVLPSEEEAREVDLLLIEAGGLFSDACFDLKIGLISQEPDPSLPGAG